MFLLKIVIISLLQFMPLIQISAYDAQQDQQNQQLCQLCIQIVDGILGGLRQGATDEMLAGAATKECIERKLQLPEVCEGIINKNLATASYILRRRPNLTSQFICSVIFQGKKCSRNKSDNPNINLTIDQNRPNLSASKNNIPSSNYDNLIVVQITDAHYDPNYEVGANAVCYAPACCRRNQGRPKDPKNGAGKWGDYRDCDPPWEAFLNALHQIKKTQKKIDYIVFTGDTVDHGVWETSTDGNNESIKRTIVAIRDTFPDIPIVPIMGNHEPHPVNQFSPSSVTDTKVSSIKLYKSIADLWNWLPVNARKTIQTGGYYTMLLRKGLRIIAMNNNDCYVFNLWLIFEPTYPTKQLQWLHDTLLEAERCNEKVHLLAHIPSHDSEYYDVISSYFHKIVDRFWNTISAQFNGHTHFDEFSVYYSSKNPKLAMNVAWNGGSITPYSNLNPNYKVYEVEPKTFQVVNQQVWIYNLTQANTALVDAPEWYKEYDFKQAYGLNSKNLSPANLDKLLDTFATNPDKSQLYWRHKVKMGDPSLANGCSDDCILDHLCQIINTDNAEDTRCKEISQKYQWNAVHKNLLNRVTT